MKRLFSVLIACLLCHAGAWAQTPPWLIASPDGRANAGKDFEVIVVSVAGEPPPASCAVTTPVKAAGMVAR